MSDVGRPQKTGRLLSFNTGFSGGIEVIDHIERRRCRVNTQCDINSANISTDLFQFPVDRAISITTNELLLPYSVAVSIRNQAGIMINQLTSGDSQYFPRDEYNIGFSAPIKLYSYINSDFKINVTSGHVKLEFESPTKISIGARSHHKHPVGTITTPPDPKKMMEAISYLTSSLKTISCERSYPTLRGHPPKISLGNKLHIPQIIEKPETGIEIEVQPNRRSIYAISPLAYYLGADIIPGNSHVIRTDHGFSHFLDDTHRGLENEIKRVLEQCFFFDCLTRTEGYYKLNLNEREKLEKELGIDFEPLYNMTLMEQIKRYLDIPFDAIKTYIPKWKKTAYIETKPNNVEVLPFLINDLATIHSAERTNIVRSEIKKSHFDNQTESTSETDILERSTDKEKTSNKCISEDMIRSGNSIEPNEYIELPDSDSVEEVWVGDGIPIGASKSMMTAFKNRLQRDPTDDNLEISVIVNDKDMMEEGNVVDEVYGSRDQLSFSVNIHHNVVVDELCELLQQDTDFLHYIGHIDSDGFECADGSLDITEIESVSVDSFFLNACSSYHQAIELLNAGSIAGIATIKPILNSGAERVGKIVAKLLNLGFPLVVALNIAKSESIVGNNYVVIGDGGLDVTQPISGSPSLCELKRTKDTFTINYKTYPTREKGIGSITIPHIKDNQLFYLTSGDTGRFSMKINDLVRFLSEEEMPTKINSTLHWSDEISIDELKK